MTEAIEELERFKSEMVKQLSELTAKQAQIMLRTMKSLLSEVQEMEEKTLAEFQGLQDQHQPFRVQALG